jgi:hypothetical protein
MQFKYKKDDAAGKPCTINPKGDRLGKHAIQKRCLLRLLTLLVGDKVIDPRNEIWQLYVLLKQLVELVGAKSLQSRVAYLHVPVEDYSSRRTAAFPDVRLRLKHHYLMQYADFTIKFGPLIYLWT